MRWILALAVLAGCANGMSEAGSVDPGPAHDGAVADGGPAGEGGADVTAPACNAPLASLNGTAMYIAGSAAAADANQPAPSPYNTCGRYISSLDQSIMTAWPVTSGTISLDAHQYTATIRATEMQGTSCAFLLHFDNLWSLPNGTLPNGQQAQQCFFSFDLGMISP